MRTQINPTSVQVWITAVETYNWATRPMQSWPCSRLRDRRLFAAFDRNGLCDYAVDGRYCPDLDASELSACVADHLATKLPKEHPCYSVAVGQFIA